MKSIWQKNSFKLLLYLEWILLGIALLNAFSFFIPRPHHHFSSHSPIFNLGATLCVAVLGFMGLRMPLNSKLFSSLYTCVGFMLVWLAALLTSRGARIFPALLLVVVIRACLLFSWRGRITTAVVAYCSYLAIQIMSLMKISPFGITLGRPLPPMLRRLPPEKIQGVLFSLAFNSALLFAFVLAFVMLLVGAMLAEHKGRAKLMLAHRRLRDYALRIEDQATLQERNRIAREIHDSVGHYLTAQSIQLENTALFLRSDSAKAASHLAKARQLSKEALANIRASVATLRINPLLERSLLEILAELTAEFKSNTNIAIASKINLMSNYSVEMNTALYRIVQEALTNIIKHSEATKVELKLQEIADKIHLTIKDNGCGFEPRENTTGFGLQGMEERTKALNGSFAIISKNGQGCTIKVEIPVLVH